MLVISVQSERKLPYGLSPFRGAALKTRRRSRWSKSGEVGFSRLLKVLEAAAARFEDGLHLTKSGGIFRQRDRGVEMMNAVMLHAEDQDISQGTREETRIPITAFFLRRVVRMEPANRNREFVADLPPIPSLAARQL